MKNDLLPPLRLAADNLLNCLDPDKDGLPYWQLLVDEDYRARLYFWWPAHNLGRWWDAMLRLEEATGFSIPAKAEETMLCQFKRFFDNEDHWCIQPEDLEPEPFPLEIHSLRESLLALTGLIRRRNSLWARQTAHAMLETVERAVREDCTWDLEQIAYYRRHPITPTLTFDPTGSNGRLIEALVLYFRQTGDELAFRLAARFAAWHFEHSTNADGSITGIADMCHTHSYLGTLRGLFLFGKLTGERRYIDRVLISYLVTVRAMVKESGYASHDIGYEKQAETTSPGDAAQLALWLALDGHPELLDDAERIVRARLLPSQVTDTPPLTPDGEGEDRYERLEERILGGFGGMQTHPHGGKRNTTDVTAAGVHTLVDIYTHIVSDELALTRILFHFDYHAPQIDLVCRRENGQALLQADCRTGKPLAIRIPGWAPVSSLSLTVNGRQAAPHIADGFLWLEAGGGPLKVTLSYALPYKEITERTDGQDYRIAFQGDEIVGISPNTSFYPFYADLDFGKGN